MTVLMPRWRNGRRVGLKNLWGFKPREGSTPSLGTFYPLKISQVAAITVTVWVNKPQKGAASF